MVPVVSDTYPIMDQRSVRGGERKSLYPYRNALQKGAPCTYRAVADPGKLARDGQQG